MDGLVSIAMEILERASFTLPTKCNCMAYYRPEKISLGQRQNFVEIL